MHKYGIPDGVDPIELRKKIDEISKELDQLRKDPEFQEECRRVARIAGTISPEDLDRPFTI